MRALVLTGPGQAEVQEVPAPVAAPGQVVVDVERVGVCGTDVEFFTGEMAYLHTGVARYPVRLGHEWCGRVASVGAGVPGSWIGRRVTGDTMLGCGHCRRCRAGRHHVCAERAEIGIQGPFHGALAEQLVVPVNALLELPDEVDATAGAMVEPGGNAWRAVNAAQVQAGERLLVLGTGAIGLLAAHFARAQGIDVHLLGQYEAPGLEQAWTRDSLPELEWDGVIDATNAAALPALALDLVEPGRRVVYIGLAGVPSTIDTRDLVLRDVTAVGILGASAGLAGAVAAYADGSVDPRPLVAATVGLDRAGDVLGGWRPNDTSGPKMHIDPRV
ncbi:alcohol dehydrogenase [Kineosporia sp. NBRC 101677]|uniref:zinc-dependent alcohol dehydrogenase n=1 Tax=Kineosporia sp. NBRC 101677 TaxID=3032197 RepID=UPI00249FE864|nr:alcohol dehydrogenase catalytic domain-containing protein [Kineosporia sp. NBRC 101677]GLY19507.1 alcohol dehydrogenase [Kineosporia sp. NBRC 101677]